VKFSKPYLTQVTVTYASWSISIISNYAGYKGLFGASATSQAVTITPGTQSSISIAVDNSTATFTNCKVGKCYAIQVQVSFPLNAAYNVVNSNLTQSITGGTYLNTYTYGGYVSNQSNIFPTAQGGSMACSTGNQVCTTGLVYLTPIQATSTTITWAQGLTYNGISFAWGIYVSITELPSGTNF
jgi:hypothetical protein